MQNRFVSSLFDFKGRKVRATQGNMPFEKMGIYLEISI